jgi:hypothetical protein
MCPMTNNVRAKPKESLESRVDHLEGVVALLESMHMDKIRKYYGIEDKEWRKPKRPKRK